MMRGFTLIETAVALAILALTLTVIYQSLGWTLRRIGEQEQRDLAWLIAQSLLDDIRCETPLSLGRREGRTAEGMSWETVVTLYSLPSDMSGGVFAPIRAGDLQPVQVRAAVRWGDSSGQGIELRSIELGAAQ